MCAWRLMRSVLGAVHNLSCHEDERRVMTDKKLKSKMKDYCMVLSDGLSIAIADQKRHGFWMLTERLEKQANDIKMKVHDSSVNAGNEDLTHAKQLLIEIEKWKAMCIGERMGAAESNSTELIWESLRGAIMARNDLDALQSVMHLRGFGRAEDLETGQRRAKVATSVLRFLFPEEWGVVDWRIAAVSSNSSISVWAM